MYVLKKIPLSGKHTKQAFWDLLFKKHSCTCRTFVSSLCFFHRDPCFALPFYVFSLFSSVSPALRRLPAGKAPGEKSKSGQLPSLSDEADASTVHFVMPPPSGFGAFAEWQTPEDCPIDVEISLNGQQFVPVPFKLMYEDEKKKTSAAAAPKKK